MMTLDQWIQTGLLIVTLGGLLLALHTKNAKRWDTINAFMKEAEIRLGNLEFQVKHIDECVDETKGALTDHLRAFAILNARSHRGPRTTHE